MFVSSVEFNPDWQPCIINDIYFINIRFDELSEVFAAKWGISAAIVPYRMKTLIYLETVALATTNVTR